jgi:hypothetical protein
MHWAFGHIDNKKDKEDEVCVDRDRMRRGKGRKMREGKKKEEAGVGEYVTRRK